jgi:O-antigen ligase
MTRRNSRVRSVPHSTEGPSGQATPVDEDGELFRALGERLRRIALGLTAALLVVRAYWPSESISETDTGSGLSWVLCLLLTLGLSLAAMLIDGRSRLRWSWADLCVYSLMILVGLSASHGAERRVAMNLAWEWGGLGLIYFLMRNLPRTRNESSSLAGAFMATAIAVAAYGLFQVAFEFPVLHEQYRNDPIRILKRAGIESSSPQRVVFENRLLGSNEPFATFALANSLAGYLVGPMVLALAVGLENMRAGTGSGSRIVALVSALVPALLLLTCLLLTKSRSAYLGLALALMVLAWRLRGSISTRILALAGAGLAGVLIVLVAAAVATRHLDLQVLTQSTKSLRYRTEYWQASWQLIKEEPGVFWGGLGPGNFGGPYLRYKLPTSSEEIRDPHNLVLDVWATAGIGAVLALLAALVLAFRDLFGPSVPASTEGDRSRNPGTSPETHDDLEPRAASRRAAPDDPPKHTGWLIASAGTGWMLVYLLGRLDPFQNTLLARWLVLGGAWLLAVLCGMPIWRRRPIPAAGLGAGTLAVVINVLAAGGIGMPTVALGLWTMIALGLNLRDDRPCGRLRMHNGRAQVFGLAIVWAALLGSFIGTIGPFWRSEAAIAEANAAVSAQPPEWQRARDAYVRACREDVFSVSPWLGLADVEYRFWVSRGAKPEEPLWKAAKLALKKALESPRNPSSLTVQSRRAAFAQEMLARYGAKLPIADVIELEGLLVESCRIGTRLYPTSAILHAELAEASADLRDITAAAEEANEALRLDRITPHADKKLPDAVRARLEQELPRWSKKPAPR